MTIATCTTFRLIEFLDNDKFSLFVTSNYHLGNTLAIVYHKVLL